MNQVCFSTFHAAIMGGTGYLLDYTLELNNPKLFVIAGVATSIAFQIFSEISYRVDKYSNPQQQSGGRHIANLLCSFTAVSLAFMPVIEPSRIRELCQASLVALSFSAASYFAAKIGTAYFLGNRDFSILCDNRNRIW